MAENVVLRLKNRLRDARQMGFKVRMEALDDEHPDWCEIAGIPTLFVNLSQTAAEQLQQLEETLSDYENAQITAVAAISAKHPAVLTDANPNSNANNNPKTDKAA